MSDEREFESGDFVWVQSKWEGPGPVAARVVARRGSQYHVAWASCAGNLFDLCVDPDELTPVAPYAGPAPAPRIEEQMLALPQTPDEPAAQAGTEPDGKVIPAAPPSQAPAEAQATAPAAAQDKPKRRRK